jgi:Tol biopolymer transport system component
MKKVAAVDPDGKLVFYSVEGGEPESIPGAREGDRVVRWTLDGKSLLISTLAAPNAIDELDISTGKRKPYRIMAVPDGIAAQDVGSPIFAADFKSYVYAYTRIGSDLYVVEGLR